MSEAMLHRRAAVGPALAPARGPLGPGSPLEGPLGPGSPLEGPLGPRHLRVVEPRRARDPRRRAQVTLCAAVAVVVAVAFGVVYLHVVMAQRQFALDRLDTQVSQAQSQYQRLRLQVAQLEAPSRIIATAEGKLGMREPASVTYLTPAGPSSPLKGPLGPSSPLKGPLGPSSPLKGPLGPSSPLKGPLGPSSPLKGPLGPGGAGASAPAGDADWPQIKSLLAGSP